MLFRSYGWATARLPDWFTERFPAEYHRKRLFDEPPSDPLHAGPFEKRDGAWKILQMTCIYEKDRLDPVVPGTAPAGFYEGVPLKGEAAASAYLAFRLAKVGRKSIPMVFARSAEERALKDEGQRWLAGA